MIQSDGVVVFDFCETLANFQTADAFVDYVREHLNDNSINRKEKINQIIRKYWLLYPLNLVEYLTRQTWSLSKRLKLWELKGVEEKILNEMSFDYYKTVIKPNLIPVTIELLKEHQKKGHEIWLVSGGYGIYLQHFIKDFKICNLISSNIKFKNGRCTGGLKGLDCVNNNKVKLFTSECQGKVLASYSDSITDLPILRLAENPVVVSKSHQIWSKEYGYKEIIWK